jgi:predicted DNA-binding transcriptional regulator YafY
MASSVENIIKMIRILQNEACVSGQELAFRIGVSVKTIQKYKQDLDQIHIFIETKKGRYGGYYLDKTVLEIHSGLSDAELTALIDSKNYILNDRNFPKSCEVLNAIDKVIQNEKLVTATRRKISLANGGGKGFSGGFERIKLDKIQAAIKDQRMLYMEYSDYQTGITECVIHPYGLINIAGKYLIIAYCEQRDEILGFNVDKIRHVALTQYHFVPPQGNEANWGIGIK